MVYVDVDDPEINNFPEVRDKIKNQEYYLPVVAYGGEVKFDGGIPLRFIFKDLREMGFKQIS